LKKEIKKLQAGRVYETPLSKIISDFGSWQSFVDFVVGMLYPNETNKKN
jgi:hypothetical protein